ncbi:MAG: tetratricopeptide repeat protein [Verrucomicrobiia bacterium]|jgi:tetratricopeptide (TPR) repeat protein
MNQNSNIKKVSISQNLVIGIILFAIIVGGIIWYFSGPKPSWLVKLEIKQFLKKNSGKSDFAVNNFKFPPKSEMEKKPVKKNLPDEKSYKGKLTKKDFQTLRDEYIELKSAALKLEESINTNKILIQIATARIEGKAEDTNLLRYLVEGAQPPTLPKDTEELKHRIAELQAEIEKNAKLLAEKEEQIKPILSDLIDFQLMFKELFQPVDYIENRELAAAQAEFIQTLRQKFDEATTYNKMYEYIGQELWVADRLFESENPDILRAALRMARQAARDAIDYAQNYWLAARIYEGYVLPNIDLASSGGRGGRRNNFTIEGLINESANIFQMNEETQNVIRCYELLLAAAPDSPRADFTRIQLASIYEQSGQTSRAVKYLKQVQSTNTLNFALRRFPSLQQYIQTR